jgi:uncharacterized protein (TIGR00299 family) protein
MTTLYFDCFAGISGDMLLGALLDCGLDFETLKREISKIDLRGYQLRVGRTERCGITATKFDVDVTGQDGHHHHAQDEHEHSHGDHHHHHEQHHHHEHQHEHQHTEEQPHRPLSEIVRLIDTSTLSETVKERALAIFRRLGEAEAKIHGVPIDDIHFHEVGAVDSIVDIVGACVGLEHLGIRKVISSALHVGSGTFECAHGTYPVPGPATAELLRQIPFYSGEIRGELVTPTGAAIVSSFATGFGPLPMMRVHRIGYGAGTRKYPDFPNVLRVFLGELIDDEVTADSVAVIETNLDDLSPQVLGGFMEKAFAAGVLDLFYTPVQMKKNRPGILLTLLCAPDDRERMIEMVWRETTTLGVRYRIERRAILRRHHLTVETQFGPIRIKIATAVDGRRLNYAPEYEDCQAAALNHDVALREVQQAALVAYLLIQPPADAD